MNETKQGWLWGPYSRLGWRVAFATFLIDQLHKWWMLLIYDIREKGKVEVFPFLDLTFVLNKGISYSMLDGVEPWMLAAFAAVASFGLWVWLAKDGNNRLMAVSLGLLIGGALGNALDRLTLGGVADFFSLHAYGYYWYIFNIADVAIVAGVVGLLYESVFLSRNDAANEH